VFDSRVIKPGLIVNCPSTHARTNAGGFHQVTLPGAGFAVAADGDCQEKGQHEEAVEVEVKAYESILVT
jgi:hypothetical protein